MNRQPRTSCVTPYTELTDGAAEAVKTIFASFTAIEDASEAVSVIIAAGIVPAALEMLDELMIRAINEGTGAYRHDHGLLTLVDVANSNNANLMLKIS